MLSGVSFNRPKFCPTATWNATGITLAGISTIGNQPSGIFINTNNNIFVPNRDDGVIYVWLAGNDTVSNTINATSINPHSIFVTLSDDIYLDSGNPANQVDVLSLNSSSYVHLPPLSIGGQCFGIFVIANDSLYCSLSDSHKVVKRSLDSNDSQSSLVAGTGVAGCLSDMLHNPWGILVDTNFDVYVADRENHRIQRFPVGQANGITMAGRGAPGTIDLNLPTGVALDADGYLFIVDSENDRIVGSGPDGFRCVVRCFSTWGSGPDQLASPISMAFDSYGSIYTTDSNNNRVQYFQLSSNSCSE